MAHAEVPIESDTEPTTDKATPLPRRFLATASCPVTRISDHGDVTTGGGER